MADQPESVLVRLDGGLGNQMFQYACGRAVALATGRRLLLDPSPISARRADRSYQLEARTIHGARAGRSTRLAARLATGQRLPQVLRRLAAAAGGRWTLLGDRGSGADTRLLTTPGNLLLEGTWQDTSLFADWADQICRDFSFREPPRPADAGLVARLRQEGSVCVHVRRGDYVWQEDIRRVHGALPLEYYHAAARLLADRGGAQRYFLFSDDPDWAEAHLAAGPTALPGPTTAVRSPPGSPAWRDLQLMAESRHFIIANSTFSWWAAWLATQGKPDRQVVAPARWFAERPAPPGLVPAAWHTVAAEALGKSKRASRDTGR